MLTTKLSKSLPLFLVCLFILGSAKHHARAYTTPPSCNNNINTWYRGADSPTNHVEGASAVVNGKLYLFGGFEAYTTTLLAGNSISVYDPVSNIWETMITPLNPMPFSASHIQAAVEANRYVWIAGGFYGDHPGTASDKVWRYDTVTDTWTAQPDLPEPRASGGLTILGNKLHYTGSLRDRQYDEDTHWTLDLTNPVAWQTQTSFLYPRNHFQGVALDGKIFAPGGQFEHDTPTVADVDILTIYDPNTNTWTEGASMPGTRSHAEAGTIVVNERILVMGGRYDEGPLHTSIVEYNPQTDSWRNVGFLPLWWISPFAVHINGKLVVTAGGIAWDAPQRETWITDLTFDCAADPPTTAADSYSTNEDTPLTITAPGVLANDTDPNGDTLTALLSSTTPNGTLSLNADGSFSYTPNPGFSGTDSFTYRANDGAADSNVVTVTITVNAGNAAPVAVADTYSTDEDTPLTITAPGVLSNDTDGDALTAVLSTTTSNGTLSLNADGSFTYTPAPGFNGTDSFTYRANDGSADSNVVTVTITVNEVNVAPVAAADAYATDEDTPLTITAPGVLSNDTDADGDALTVTLVQTTNHGSLSLNADGSFNYEPDENFNGSDTFTYVVNDNSVDSSQVTVTLTINPVNDLPVARNDSFATGENTPLSVAAGDLLSNDSDVDGDSLTVVLETDVASGTLTLNPDGSFVYEPSATFFGTDSFTYYLTDGTGNSVSSTVTIQVDNSNNPPQGLPDVFVMDENTTLIVDAPGVLGNDIEHDGDPMQAVLDSDPANGTVTLNPDGQFEYTSAPDFTGDDSFTYIVEDGVSQSGVVLVTITVNDVNVPPIAVEDAFSAVRNRSLSVEPMLILMNDSDPDNDPLTTSVHTPPVHGTVRMNSNGSFVYDPELNYMGQDEFEYQLNDGNGGTSITSIYIDVKSAPRNDDDDDDDDDSGDAEFVSAESTDLSENVLEPNIEIYDPAISKIGFLLPGQLGVNGEQLEWVVTVRNNGNIPGQAVVVEDTLREELRIDRVETPKGTVSISGQTVQIDLGTLQPGEVVQFSIFTTVIEGGATVENIACMTASNSDTEICSDTSTAVGTLPRTGEKSNSHHLLLALIGGLGLILVGAAALRFQLQRH